jgi:hypothetical protein
MSSRLEARLNLIFGASDDEQLAEEEEPEALNDELLDL